MYLAPITGPVIISRLGGGGGGGGGVGAEDFVGDYTVFNRTDGEISPN